MALTDEDGGIYYAQLRGFLQDQVRAIRHRHKGPNILLNSYSTAKKVLQ